MIFLLSSGKLRFEKAPKNVKHTRQMQNKNYSFRFVFYGNIFLARKASSEAFRKTLRKSSTSESYSFTWWPWVFIIQLPEHTVNKLRHFKARSSGSMNTFSGLNIQFAMLSIKKKVCSLLFSFSNTFRDRLFMTFLNERCYLLLFITLHCTVGALYTID